MYACYIYYTKERLPSVDNSRFSSITRTVKMKASAVLIWWETNELQIKKSHKANPEAHASAIDSTVNAMLQKAVSRHATDVHLEPRERTIVVRFRIDGLLQQAAKLPLSALDGIDANLKNRARLAADESRMPQSGEFIFSSNDTDINVQLATMPTIMGEKIALHLNPRLSEPANLEALGYWGSMLRRIEYAVAEPHGLVIATSPQRIGTSMSLIGIVQLLNNPALNIVTLEDPIEHRVAGITQSQIDSANGISFSNGLEAVLKQDPNVIMISDMHQAETLQKALDVSMRGRLILGGLHVNSAAQAIAHLLHMGGEPYLVSSALKVVMAQRFIRRLCPECRDEYRPSKDEIAKIKRLLKLAGITAKHLHELEKSAAEAAIGDDENLPLSSNESTVLRLWRAKPEGCPHCKFSGYRGRVGACEVIENSDNLKKTIAKNPSTAQIQTAALADGMLPLQLDGLIKALRGITSLDEVLLLASGAW